MSICKTFEVLDSMTFIPVLAVKLEPGCEADRYLFRRCGYDPDDYNIMLTYLAGRYPANSDMYDWAGNSTMKQAHNYILDHFDDLESGAVIDVEFITGRTKEPKKSERET